MADKLIHLDNKRAMALLSFLHKRYKSQKVVVGAEHISL